MLEIRPYCECCATELTPDGEGAFICSFECTFCRDCADGHLERVCPNCRGELVRRPARAAALLAEFPVSSKRIVKDHGHPSGSQ